MATEAPLSDLQNRVALSSGSHSANDSSKSDDEISLLDLLIVFAERKRLIFRITAAFAVLSLIVSLILPKRYTATLTLLPPQQNSTLGGQLAAQLGSLGGMAATLTGGGGNLLKNPNDMYVAMFKSRTVEDAMIQNFGLMQEYHEKYLSDTRKKFEHYVTVVAGGKDGLIHITVEDRNPKRAAELANGYVDQFRSLTQHLAITEASQRRSFFEQQLKAANQNLANSEEALKQTQQKTGLIALDAQARALVESAASLRAQIAAKEVQIQAMQTYATGKNAQLVQAEQELTSMRSQLAKLGGNNDSAGDIIVPKGQMTQAGIEYVRNLRDVKYYETIFEILARQFELAKLDEAKEGALIQVVDPAITPDKKSSPKRALIVIGSTVVGLLVALLIALFQTGMERAKENPESAPKLRLLQQMLVYRRKREMRTTS